ncbi:MAG: hypothetical protein SF339_07265 [Blastocatellia bacterium]|nr:hypothetical protein [Blastocatellia bacterium]
MQNVSLILLIIDDEDSFRSHRSPREIIHEVTRRNTKKSVVLVSLRVSSRMRFSLFSGVATRHEGLLEKSLGFRLQAVRRRPKTSRPKAERQPNIQMFEDESPDCIRKDSDDRDNPQSAPEKSKSRRIQAGFLGSESAKVVPLPT